MSSSRRIAYLVSQYPAVNHTYILREVRELRKLGWEIDVASIRRDTRPVSQLTAEEREEQSCTWYVKPQGFRGALRAHFLSLTTHTRSYFRGMLSTLRLGGTDIRKGIRNLLYFTEALLIGQWMQNQELNHVHIHYASTVGLLLVNAFPVTISITIHGSAEFENPTAFHLQEKIEAANFICAISTYGRNQLMNNSGRDQWTKLETVPLGIDPELFVPLKGSLPKQSVFNIISVGSLTQAKAHHILIDAASHILRSGRRVRLRLVGEGPYRSALESQIVTCGLSDAVTVEGALNQDQLRALYRGSDAFVLASLAEGVPVVLMEAMAMEIPCVATQITGIPELIENEVEGLLVEPSNVQQLTSAIQRLMDDPDFRRRLAIAGRRKILNNYNLSKNVAMLAQVFEKRI